MRLVLPFLSTPTQAREKIPTRVIHFSFPHLPTVGNLRLDKHPTEMLRMGLSGVLLLQAYL